MPAQIKGGQMALPLTGERRIFEVSELNSAVERLFETEFRSIWVAGEISGCRPAASGHFYFSLKDPRSQIKCVLFKGNARFVRFQPRDGLAVLARGNLEVYEARGEYQLIVEVLEPRGAGALQLAFEQLKKKLAAEGLFEAARKRPLPKLARRIGIVTSPGGAVIRDILHVLERRFAGLHIRLFPAQVQGEGAAEQVCAGLKYFSDSQWPDVVLLARGGGSLEDLWTFNEEAVARAIAASSVPVISAIGHETDFTIADFVADVRAPTPSAAAEIVVSTKESLLESVAACRAKAVQALRYRLLVARRDLYERGTNRAAALMHRSIALRVQRVDEIDFRLRHAQRAAMERNVRRLAGVVRRLEANDLRLRLARTRHRHEFLDERMRKAIEARLWQARRRNESLDLHLRQLSPLGVLARGYAIVEDARGRILRASSETAIEERLKIRLHRGQVEAAVIEVRDGERGKP
jgi:exodeoxyribonuclease VII large subunit